LPQNSAKEKAKPVMGKSKVKPASKNSESLQLLDEIDRIRTNIVLNEIKASTYLPLD
jgi:hypothetical protein